MLDIATLEPGLIEFGKDRKDVNNIIGRPEKK